MTTGSSRVNEIDRLTQVNGQWSSDSIDCTDRGMCFGDGVFETVLVHNEKAPLLEAHFSRLFSSLKTLKIQINTEWVRQCVASFFSAAAQVKGLPSHFIVKVLITRGVGGAGYSPAAGQNASSPTLVVTARNLTTLQCPVSTLFVCSDPVFPSKKLCGLKHTSRLEYVLAAQALRESGVALLSCTDYADGLVCRDEGAIVEALHHNVFWVKDGVLNTPKIQLGGVRGVMREIVLERLINSIEGLNIHEIEAPLNEILTADEVFMTNAVRGIVAVHTLKRGANVLAQFPSMGSITAQLVATLNQMYPSVFNGAAND